MNFYNVLVLPGGTEIGLEIWRALKDCKDVRLFSANMDLPNHGKFVFKSNSILANVRENSWLTDINKIIDEKKIDYIFPAHDDVITALAENQDKLNSKTVSSPHETCMVTRSKSLTYDLFKNILPVPIQYNNLDSIRESLFFVKPEKGQGSQRVYLAENKENLHNYFEKFDDLIVTEYLPGEEFTIDCFSDRDKGLLYCGARERIKTRNGISVSSKSINKTVFNNYAIKISQKLKLYGAWFFQVKKDISGIYKLLEIAPRIAGTMALNRVKGINFPLLSIYEQERIQIELLINEMDVEINRAFTNRYQHNVEYNSVYVDFDDTLIANEKVNTSMIRFLYQSFNEGKKLILLTKHRNGIVNSLKKYRLDSLFDEIISINGNENKSGYIHEKNAIFIDDSFSERKEVHEKKGIYTFDSSMLELLIDEKV